MTMTERRRKKVAVAVAMPYLPDDLIIEIVVRLPVKSLLQFRCVSKLFCSLISHNPQFAISHFDLASAAASPSSLTHRLLYLPITDGYASKSVSIDLDSSSSLSSSVALNLSYLPPMSAPIIKGSCRGFILLFEMVYSFLVIWNPLIRAYKQLPSTDLFSNQGYIDLFGGFGYDASTDDYLVVLGTPYYGKSDCTLFSLRANAWTTIEGTHFPYDIFGEGHGAHLNGVIHWLTYRSDIHEYAILAFDLMEKSFSEVPLPPGIDIKDDNFNPWDTHPWNIGVLGGSLSVSIPGYDATYVWVMKEYKVMSSWSKSVAFVMPSDFKVGYPPYGFRNHFFFPIYFTKSGDIVGTSGDICGTNAHSKVLKFNAKGQLLDHHSFPGAFESELESEPVMYTESLLSFPLN